MLDDDVNSHADLDSNLDLLRFITCGSVDDGKSTLIGRLLYDSKLVFDDQLRALESDSARVGTVEGGIDFALLVDGLQAEREQGITIDVAYRFFSSEKRKFVSVDAPGHEQYTRNMATGASNVDLAIILVDARKGVVVQTRRHAYICHLMGIRQFILAVNKIDLTSYSQNNFQQIKADFQSFALKIGMGSVLTIPLSALKGDNITTQSMNMPWYAGPTLLEGLDNTPITKDDKTGDFSLPVQWVNRPNLDFRGYSGTIASGHISVGDSVVISPSGIETRVQEIHSQTGNTVEASRGEAVTLVLADDIDVSRGDVITQPGNAIQVTDQFASHIIWLSANPLIPGRPYVLKIGTTTTTASVTSLKHEINVNTLEEKAAKGLVLNSIGYCNVACDKAITISPYNHSKEMGGFILVDRTSNETIAAGMIAFGLRRATNLRWQDLDIDKSARSGQKQQKPCILWFTGLSGSGKSTIANLVEKKLFDLGRHTYLLDGDNIRHGLNKDLGFTDIDRVENIRRVAEASKLFIDAGLITLVSFISPFRAERRLAREMVEGDEFIEIFIDTPLSECETRDPKGLYAKARKGDIKNFTGIDSPYEPPKTPDIHIDTTMKSADQACDEIIAHLQNNKYI